MKKTVLIVDDNEDIRQVIADVLDLEGYETAIAGDGAEALAAMRALQPDLVLLDLMMPRVSGWELCARRRAEPALASIPVVVMSAAPTAGVDGALAVIRKPFALAVLLDVVRQHAR